MKNTLLLLLCLVTGVLPLVASVPTTPSSVTVSGRKILLQRKMPDNSLSAPIVFTINGVDWNPTPIGSNVAAWASFYVQDLNLISAMHASVVRTYDPLPLNATGLAVLDYCYTHNIYVIMNIGYGQSDAAIAGTVNFFKQHPALLFFEVGNEWNYNNGYGTFGTSLASSAATVQHIAGIIKANAPARPVASSLGNAYDPTPFNSGVFTTCANVDIWGFNTYVVGDASAAVTAAAAYSAKPYYFSEIGTDAFNELISQEDTVNQSKYSLLNWTSVPAKFQLTTQGGTFSGEVFFEFADEWWKAPGSYSVQNNGGAAGPAYDNFFNEEWFGVVDIHRNPRPIYTALQTAWKGLNAIPVGGTLTQTITFPAVGSVVVGQTVTLVASASSKLPVTYAITSGPATLSGNKVKFTAPDAVVITASQAGNASYAAAKPVSIRVVVDPLSQTIAPFKLIPSKVYPSSPFAIALPKATSGLPVTVVVKSGPAQIAGNQITLTGPGAVTLVASQAGNATYTAARSVATSFSVDARQKITFPAIANQVLGVKPITLHATASSQLAVTYTVTGPAKVSGSLLTITGAGTVSVTAHQAGNGLYLAAPAVVRTFTVK